MSADHDHLYPPAKRQKTDSSSPQESDGHEPQGEMSPSDQILSRCVIREMIDSLDQHQGVHVPSAGDEDNNNEQTKRPEGESQGTPGTEANTGQEEILPEWAEKHTVNSEGCYVKKRFFLEDVSSPVEELPVDWITVCHISGMPVYMHRPTRVCTMARPYSLGGASLVKHSPPLSAIPCYAYRRGSEEEAKKRVRDQEVAEQTSQTTGDKLVATQSSSTTEQITPTLNISIKREVVSNDDEPDGSANNESRKKRAEQAGAPGASEPSARPAGAPPQPGDNAVSHRISPEQINNYCKTLFRFKTVTVYQSRSLETNSITHESRPKPKSYEHPITWAEATPNNRAPRLASTGLTENKTSVRRYQATKNIGDTRYGVGQGRSEIEHAPHSAPAAHNTQHSAPAAHNTPRSAPAAFNILRSAPTAHNTPRSAPAAYNTLRRAPAAHNTPRSAPAAHNTLRSAPAAHNTPHRYTIRTASLHRREKQPRAAVLNSMWNSAHHFHVPTNQSKRDHSRKQREEMSKENERYAQYQWTPRAWPPDPWYNRPPGPHHQDESDFWSRPKQGACMAWTPRKTE
ncbi:unnamed protein product [Chrysodeixis includens]|uniref:Uncharacterized protein n=1 Tax=Chrysodeixis includens TaxID=689277 RepID=A0A9P0BXN2_CHRIL|nr:unnamed protein product [Chrysodeixis includens]